MKAARVPSEQTNLMPQALEVYRRQIDPKVEAENEDRFVAFNLETEEFEIGDDVIETVQRLKRRHPTDRPFVFRVGGGGSAVDRFGSPRFASEL
jgi:hypothetical protein